MTIKRETVEERKALPVATGVLDYFPDAILAVAEVSRVGNEQHHPGAPLHWDKSKSTDEADALMRHLLDRGKRDTDGMRHSAKVAWRALAMLQRELDAEAAASDGDDPLPRVSHIRPTDGGERYDPFRKGYEAGFRDGGNDRETRLTMAANAPCTHVMPAGKLCQLTAMDAIHTDFGMPGHDGKDTCYHHEYRP